MVDLDKIKGPKAEGKGAEKERKVKLTKEQRVFLNNLLTLENRIVVCREYMQLWLAFYRFFSGDITRREITPNDEKGFFQVITQLARKQFQFTELMGDTFERGNDISNVLGTAISLAHIQSMQENTRSKLELDWHGLYLDMSKALGRLCRMVPGAANLTEALDYAQGLSANGAQTGAGKSKLSGTTKSKLLAALLAFPPMGVLGLDCFYLGSPKKGILRLVTGGGAGIWALVDFVRILTNKVTDANGKPLT